MTKNTKADPIADALGLSSPVVETLETVIPSPVVADPAASPVAVVTDADSLAHEACKSIADATKTLRRGLAAWLIIGFGLLKLRQAFGENAKTKRGQFIKANYPALFDGTDPADRTHATTMAERWDDVLEMVRKARPDAAMPNDPDGQAALVADVFKASAPRTIVRRLKEADAPPPSQDVNDGGSDDGAQGGSDDGASDGASNNPPPPVVISNEDVTDAVNAALSLIVTDAATKRTKTDAAQHVATEAAKIIAALLSSKADAIAYCVSLMPTDKPEDKPEAA